MSEKNTEKKEKQKSDDEEDNNTNAISITNDIFSGVGQICKTKGEITIKNQKIDLGKSGEKMLKQTNMVSKALTVSNIIEGVKKGETAETLGSEGGSYVVGKLAGKIGNFLIGLATKNQCIQIGATALSEVVGSKYGGEGGKKIVEKTKEFFNNCCSKKEDKIRNDLKKEEGRERDFFPEDEKNSQKMDKNKCGNGKNEKNEYTFPSNDRNNKNKTSNSLFDNNNNFGDIFNKKSIFSNLGTLTDKNNFGIDLRKKNDFSSFKNFGSSFGYSNTNSSSFNNFSNNNNFSNFNNFSSSLSNRNDVFSSFSFKDPSF